MQARPFVMALAAATALAFAASAQAAFLTSGFWVKDVAQTTANQYPALSSTSEASWSVDGSGEGSFTISPPSSLAGGYSFGGKTTDVVDPLIHIVQLITNNDAYAWSDYTVNIQTNGGTQINNLTVLAPVFFPNYLPTVISSFGVSNGFINYSGGLVAPGQTLEVRFDLDVQPYAGGSSGLFSYTINNVPTGVPEPASLAVLGVAGVALLARRRRD